MNNERFKVKIPITKDILENEKKLEKLILDNESEFYGYFERLIDCGDCRVQLMGESLVINSTTINTEQGYVVLECTFDDYFYAGCKDINSNDEHEVILEFEIDNNYLVFDIEMPLAWTPDSDIY
jgi:hypothetical protein